MTWLSNLLSLALAGASITSALPQPHEDLPWNINNRRSLFQKRNATIPALTVPTGLEACAASVDPVVTAPKENIFLDFSNDEIKELLKYIHDPAQGLNLTKYPDAGPWDNHVTVTEYIVPNKTAAVAYLDGCGPKPDKYARVVVSHGASGDEPEAWLEDYMVGPFPISEKTTIQPFTFAYNKGSSKTPDYAKDSDAIRKFRNDICASMKDITIDLLGSFIEGGKNDTSSLQAIDPMWEEDGKIKQWVQWRLIPKIAHYSTNTLLTQGLFMKFDITGRDPSKWYLEAILYDNKMYKTVEEFREAWKKPDFNRLPKAKEGDWATTKQQGKPLPYDEQPPPVQVQKQKRWAVDKKNQYVQWMDFSFYMGFARDVGITLYDIKYKGKRIMYELGLQEAIAHYAGNDPKSSGTAFLDGYYGFGPYAYELVKGYDCPESSTFFDTVLYQNGETTTNRDSICLFEQDMGYTMQRHTTGKYAGVTKNIGLVLRAVYTIGNYDYNFDYVFYYDGSIEVKVRASGYIQSAYYAHNEEYGYRINEHSSGSMHDHVLTFKADLDIMGTNNTFEKTLIVPKTVKYVWANEERNTMALERHEVLTEDDGKINWAPNGAGIYTVINKDEPNQWGEYPGYRIMPGSGTPVHMEVVDSTILRNSAAFGTHHMYVTKQKDTEPRLAAAANNMAPSEPLVDFSKFFDGESVAQEDIVLWFNLGMHHVPHSGDLPNTVMTTAQSSVFFTPHNYIDMDPTRATNQQVEVVLTKDGKVDHVNEFGKKEPSCGISIHNPDLSAYEGAVSVSKLDFLEYNG
ncbi:copper amine oxidase [Ascobolus immersus RN42]|uniref:Amine oxidase n=1 Tax=Ascobolus immersus RN42 TaxID=1160509 RepID=A0A3N4ILA5_ASCIM|nr:copper amine oxidase [Ascobolus immersus RN42]